MDRRLLKISVGLALQSAIPRGIELEALHALYSNPNLEEASQLHSRLMVSGRHGDREVGFWLEPVLEPRPATPDHGRLAGEMRKMEFLLYELINRAGEARQEINDWMDYISNAIESLTDGFWIDAKILLSQALEVSQSESVERTKSDPSLRYEIDVLQRATAEYFQEVRAYPLKLAIPEERLETLLKVQEILLDLMQIQIRKEPAQKEMLAIAIRRLNTAVRYLMNKEKTAEAARQEVRLAFEYLKGSEGKLSDEGSRRLAHQLGERMKELIDTHVP